MRGRAQLGEIWEGSQCFLCTRQGAVCILPQCKEHAGLCLHVHTPPERVLIPLNMHIGAPASPVVSEGDMYM